MSVIGDRTRQRRQELGLSQPELAERVGCKQQSIDQLERGEVARPRYLVELAEALKTTPQWLQGKEGLAEPSSSPFSDSPAAAEAREARERKFDIVRAMTDDPDLFAWLLGAYRDLYAEEVVAITEAEIIATVLDDYAGLVTDYESRDDRQRVAAGLVAKQRQWVRANKGKSGE